MYNYDKTRLSSILDVHFSVLSCKVDGESDFIKKNFTTSFTICLEIVKIVDFIHINKEELQ